MSEATSSILIDMVFQGRKEIEEKYDSVKRDKDRLTAALTKIYTRSRLEAREVLRRDLWLHHEPGRGPGDGAQAGPPGS